MVQIGHSVPKDVGEAAKVLAAAHKAADAALVEIHWFPDDLNKEVRLLEVTPDTLETGSVDAFAFLPTDRIPFYVVIAELTPHEWKDVERGIIPLPNGWRLGHQQRVA